MHIIEEAGKAEKGRRVDAFVQSTDKNLMVPVGGSIISGYDSEFVRNISQNYPGKIPFLNYNPMWRATRLINLKES